MIGDNYTSDDMVSAFEEGMKNLTVNDIDFVRSKTKGTEGIKISFFINENAEHKMFKTFYESKFFNRFFTSFIVAIGLNPKDLDSASKAGRFREWITAKVPGRSGEFWCEKGEPNAEGKRYLSPWTQAEIDLREWQKAQGTQGSSSARQGGSFSDGSSHDSMTPPDFDSDIPF